MKRTPEFVSDHLNNNQPKYVLAYRHLLEKIRSMSAGQQLPAEKNLAREYKISRNTLRQALQMLHEDKLIYKRKGAGTYVSGSPYIGKSELGYYRTSEESLKQSGSEYVVKETLVTLEDIDAITAETLNINNVFSMYVVSRVYVNKFDDDICYFYCEDFIPGNIDLDLTQLSREEFIQEYEKRGKASICNITSISAGKFHSEKLKIDEGSAILVLQQLILNKEGEKLYLNKTYLNMETTENSLVIKRNSLS